MITEFKLNEKEAKAAEAFEKKHRHPDVGKGAIGGHIDYIFTPNSIYRGLVMKCNICREEKNITDYSAW